MDGVVNREQSFYLLDPWVNDVPELPLGGEDPVGRHALRFTGEYADSGRVLEPGGAAGQARVRPWLA